MVTPRPAAQSAPQPAARPAGSSQSFARATPEFHEKPVTPKPGSAVGTSIGDGAYGSNKPKGNKPKFGHFLIYLVLFLIIIIAGVVIYNAFSGKEASAKDEQSAYEYALQCDDISKMKQYLETYNSAPRAHRDSIQARLSMISKMNREWDDVLTSNSRNAFKNYADNNPESPYVNIARHKVDSIDWAHAKEEDTDEAYAAYLKEHPSGEHTSEARGRGEGATAPAPATPATEETQPAPGSSDAEMTITEADRTAVHGKMRTLFQGINGRNPERINQAVSTTMTRFLTKTNATNNDVIDFMNKLWGPNVKNLNWYLGQDLTINKRAAGAGAFEYTADFTATLKKRVNVNGQLKDEEQAYKVRANVNKDGKISELTMTKSAPAI